MVVCCLLVLMSRGLMIWWLLVCDEAESGGEGREITQITRAGSKSRESRVKSRESGANKKANCSEFQAGKSNNSRQIVLESARSGVILYVICGPN